MAFAMLAFVVLFKFTDALSGAMTAPFVIDLGFTRNEYAAIVKGRRPRRAACRRLLPAVSSPAPIAATSLWIGASVQAAANLSFSWLAVAGRDPTILAIAITVENFHQRHRHRDVRRLTVGAVPEPALHGDAIRPLLTALAAVGRTLFIGGRRLHRRKHGWAGFS